MADTRTATSDTTKHGQIVVNPDGSDIGSILPTGAATSAKQDTQTALLGGIAGLLPTSYDYISQAQATTTDTWVFKTGGASGTTVATITINYTDATKEVISTVVKT